MNISWEREHILKIWTFFQKYELFLKNPNSFQKYEHFYFSNILGERKGNNQEKGEEKKKVNVKKRNNNNKTEKTVKKTWEKINWFMNLLEGSNPD